MDDLDPVATAAPIDGGWCVKTVDGGCIDILRLMYNYRVVLSGHAPNDTGGHPTTYSRGYCYFGHGYTESGQPRTMRTALLAATAAAMAWDGCGNPAGYDKRAGA